MSTPVVFQIVQIGNEFQGVIPPSEKGSGGFLRGFASESEVRCGAAQYRLSLQKTD
jgi:hypothetical protein